MKGLREASHKFFAGVGGSRAVAQYVNSHVQLPNLQVSTRVIGGSLNTTNIAISNTNTNTSSNMITTTSYQQQHSVDEQRNRLVSRVAVG